MIETPHYIRFRQTGEVSGFRTGKIDRFAAASITLPSPRRKRPPGVPGDTCNLAGITCPKYSIPRQLPCPMHLLSPTACTLSKQQRRKEGKKERRKEVRKEGRKEGRKKGKKEGKEERRRERRKDGRKGGRKEVKKEGKKKGTKERR